MNTIPNSSTRQSVSRTRPQARGYAFLQIIRDTLNRIARHRHQPDYRLYGAVVTGSRRSKDHRSREKLASQGLWWDDLYSALASERPSGHCFGVPCHHIARGTESSKRRTRRDYMRNLASLQGAQASIAAEKTRLDGMLPPPVAPSH